MVVLWLAIGWDRRWEMVKEKGRFRMVGILTSDHVGKMVGKKHCFMVWHFLGNVGGVGCW